MSGPEFPVSVLEVIKTLKDLCLFQNKPELVEILESAQSLFDAVDYDNWNGGTTIWNLRLEIPTPLFAKIQKQLDTIEKDFLENLRFLERIHLHDSLTKVIITPNSGGLSSPSHNETQHLWVEGYLKAFISHTSRHKAVAATFKAELAYLGVSAFVAHESIEPTLEWRDQLELSLNSTDALIALLTNDVLGSRWVDQEIGWALGRGKPIIPISLGKNPYGFAGKFQAILGDTEHIAANSHSVVQALLLNPNTRNTMRRGLIKAFVNSNCFRMAISSSRVIVSLRDITKEEKDDLWKACVENNQIVKANGVTTLIYDAVGLPPPKRTNIIDEDLSF